MPVMDLSLSCTAHVSQLSMPHSHAAQLRSGPLSTAPEAVQAVLAALPVSAC